MEEVKACRSRKRGVVEAVKMEFGGVEEDRWERSEVA